MGTSFLFILFQSAAGAARGESIHASPVDASSSRNRRISLPGNWQSRSAPSAPSPQADHRARLAAHRASRGRPTVGFNRGGWQGERPIPGEKESARRGHTGRSVDGHRGWLAIIRSRFPIRGRWRLCSRVRLFRHRTPAASSTNFCQAPRWRQRVSLDPGQTGAIPCDTSCYSMRQNPASTESAATCRELRRRARVRPGAMAPPGRYRCPPPWPARSWSGRRAPA